MVKEKREVMRSQEEKRRGHRLGGCIRTSKGPWLVHRTTKDGGTVTKLRYPSDRERQNNKQRERRRRSITKKIFAGLRAHGNYNLPKHADTNDLLKALCEEAGWHVDEDGNVHKKESPMMQMPSFINMESDHVVKSNLCEDQDYCRCGDVISLGDAGGFQAKASFSMEFSYKEHAGVSLGRSCFPKVD